MSNFEASNSTLARCVFISGQLAHNASHIADEREVMAFSLMQAIKFLLVMWHRTQPSPQPAGWQMCAVGDKRTG